MITQIIHPQSEARFEHGNSRFIRCVGDAVELDVSLSGSGPWTVAYEIVFESKKSQFLQSDIKDSRFQIKSPPFEKPGAYVIDLIS